MRRPSFKTAKRERAQRVDQVQTDDKGLMSIFEFCAWAGISEKQYYAQRRNNLGPREMRLGDRVVRIARSEAEDWAKRMTEASKHDK
jgi:predicted DNA-binding transcriptional regulator AlpA